MLMELLILENYRKFNYLTKRNLKKSSTKRTNVRKNKKSLKKRGGACYDLCNKQFPAGSGLTEEWKACFKRECKK